VKSSKGRKIESRQVNLLIFVIKIVGKTMRTVMVACRKSVANRMKKVILYLCSVLVRHIWSA